MLARVLSLSLLSFATQVQAQGALVNARIHTLDAAHPVATAIAWDAAGRIVAVGDEVPKTPGAIDAGGRTVVPGLIDAHGHVMGLGQSLLRADLVGTASKAEVGIGVAVAVNVVDKTTLASLGTSSHTVNGLAITARQYGNPATPVVDDYETTATSGAGGSKVGIAGSLALNLINATTTAHTLGNVNAGAGASSITADQRITAKATAAPSGNGVNGGKVGIGASVALNLLTVTTTAELPNGVTFSNGGGLTVSANGVLGDPAGASVAHGRSLLARLTIDLVAAVDDWRSGRLARR